jgi:hypothetical protein
MVETTFLSVPKQLPAYESPRLIELGTVSTQTATGLHGCYWGKELGGSDGWTFMGINVPISACSS